MPEENKQKGLAYNGALRIVVLVCGFIFQILMAKMLKVDEYGRYGILLAGSVVFTTIGSLGCGRALARFFPSQVIAFAGRCRTNFILVYLVARTVGVSVLIFCVLVALRQSTGGLSFAKQEIAATIVWYISLVILADVEALTQSRGRYLTAPLVYSVEIMSRLFIACAYYFYAGLDLSSAILLIAVSNGVACATLVGHLLWRRPVSAFLTIDRATSSVSIKYVLVFSFGVYASGCAWLASSPATSRLLVSDYLPITALAAATFCQMLVTSAHRSLPIHLFASAIEGFVFSQKEGLAHDNVLAVVCVILKLEFTLISIGIILSISVPELIFFLIDKPSFSAYWYFLPLLVLQALGSSCYRIIEIIAGLFVISTIYYVCATISLVYILVLYITVPAAPLSAFILFPLIDLSLKIALSVYVLRKKGIKSGILFDWPMLATIIFSACLLAAAVYTLICILSGGLLIRLFLGISAVAIYIFAVCRLKPIRAREIYSLRIYGLRGESAVKKVILLFSRHQRDAEMVL